MISWNSAPSYLFAWLIYFCMVPLCCIFLQVKSGTIFDNVLITDDADHAEKVGEDTWGVTKVSFI